MIVLIVAGILLFVVGWLVFWPWVLEVDTSSNQYQVYQKGTFRFWLTTDLKFRLRIFGISVPLKAGSEESS